MSEFTKERLGDVAGGDGDSGAVSAVGTVNGAMRLPRSGGGSVPTPEREERGEAASEPDLGSSAKDDRGGGRPTCHSCRSRSHQGPRVRKVGSGRDFASRRMRLRAVRSPRRMPMPR